MDSPATERRDASSRRYFTDTQARTWWIERMGRLDEKTVFWIGGSGFEPSAFSADHECEEDFTVSELLAALADLGFNAS